MNYRTTSDSAISALVLKAACTCGSAPVVWIRTVLKTQSTLASCVGKILISVHNMRFNTTVKICLIVNESSSAFYFLFDWLSDAPATA